MAGVLESHPRLDAVIVGAGRSGSGYISQVLNRAGIPCGHEQVFGFNEPPEHELVAESSWMAVPYLSELVFPLAVFHQVRHPETSLRSMLGGEMFGDGRRNRWFAVRKRWLPMTGDDVVDAMRIWTLWNQWCELHVSRIRRWRVEDVTAELLYESFMGLSVQVWELDFELALERTPKIVNTHRRLASFTLDDLPRGADRDALLFTANRYGYEV